MAYTEMVQGHQAVAIAAAVGIIFIFATLTIGGLLRPRDPNPVKQETYECGEITIGTTRITIGVQYYLYALLFLLFDIETIFLFPWAVSYLNLGIMGFIEMMLFIGVLGLGLAVSDSIIEISRQAGPRHRPRARWRFAGSREPGCLPGRRWRPIASGRRWR